MRKWIGQYVMPEGIFPAFIEVADPQPTERKSMLKKDELANPRSCLSRAAPEEPIFVLRGKDALAAQTVRLWAAMALGRHEPDKIVDALQLADMMDAWRKQLPPPPVDPGPMFCESATEPGPRYTGDLVGSIIQGRPFSAERYCKD